MTRTAEATEGVAVESAADRADSCGWPLHDREKNDFLHRIRAFPREVGDWRDALVQRLREGLDCFPAIDPTASKDELRALVDEGISYLREIARMVALLYGTPRLGNKDDPVDELVYIILSRKTREDAYRRTFEALKEAFPTWDDLLAAPRKRVEKLVRPGGLPVRKADSLFGALRILKERFGSCTLEPAREWSDAELEDFLCSLPEIHRKSAYCIMMYSFGRAVLPVDTHVGRVLARLGPFRELGLDLSGLDHKKLQAVLADLIPPNLRYSLHVNLIEHGRKYCKAPSPTCEGCPLTKFCAHYRSAETARVEVTEAPNVIDLFCGAGGLSEGFRRAGFRILGAIDKDAGSLKTYRLNHPEVLDERVLCRDMAELSATELKRLAGRRKLDVLCSAPPCQGFSHVGNRSKKTHQQYRLAGDERNFLFEHAVAAALTLKPRLFLMENVPGMNSASGTFTNKHDNMTYLEAVARELEKAGYKTSIWRLNASAFGVPQDRIRCFLVASLGVAHPRQPTEEYQDIQRRSFDVDALPPVTLDDAIFDLPPRAAGSGPTIDLWTPEDSSSDRRSRRYLTKFRLLGRSPLLFNHVARYNNERDLELYALLRPGEDSVHALERHKRHDLMRYRADVFDDKYARLRADRPSKTIVSHLAKDGNGYIHPSQVRSLTIREAARIQSFGDDFILCGAPTDQWVQLGNAVPPVLAEAIARTFIGALRTANGGKKS